MQKPLFTDLNIAKSIVRAIDDIGITHPTKIQYASFAPIKSGKDIVGIAQTGTGKTFAYLVPVLSLWRFQKSPSPQILIIVPTRELVAQVKEEAQKLTTYMNVVTIGVYGGANIRTQRAEVVHGADVVIGTPGRLMDLMLDGVLKTKQLKHLIIDEVDEMLNLGFRTQLKNILEFMPEKRQSLMFSATLSQEVEQVIDIFSTRYTKIEAAPSGSPLENINQYAYELPNFNSKANMLEYLLNNEEGFDKVLVFVSSKKMADALHDRLVISEETPYGIIHSSKAQNARFDAVNRFMSGELRLLIATDLIARGVDITGVSHVVNFDMPDITERYIHRIGRTGRAEQKGVAISFVSQAEWTYKEAAEQLMDYTIPIRILPENVTLTDELIPLEQPVDFVPFNTHKQKQHSPSGEAFHDKLDKNKKENKRRNFEKEMKKKYKKQYRKKDKR